MTNNVCRLGAGLLFAAGLFGQTPDKPATVQGSVVNELTGEPIPRAHVTLMGAKNGTHLQYGALTTAGGTFRIDGVTAADFSANAERVGFVALNESGVTRITLQADEKKTDVALKLTPTGAITGRVTDSDGDPVEAANVFADGARGRISASTDDRGVFRIGGLAPGRYRVKAAASSRAAALGPEIRTDGTEELYNGTTYFPGTSDAKTASRVQVRAAVDATGIDIRMVRASFKSVRGRVTGLPPGTERATVTASTGESSASAIAKKDGTFELWMLDPGKYVIRAQAQQGPLSLAPGLLSGGDEVEVANSNVEGLELRLVPPGDISGVLEFDDDQAEELPKPPRQPEGQPPIIVQRRITLTNPQSGGPTVVVSDNAFHIQTVFAGRYRITVSPDNVYVKSMRYGSTVIDGSLLDLSNGATGADLSILLSSATGSVSGIVHADSGSAAGVRIVLTPADGEQRNRYVTVGPDGSWSIEGLAPGSYKIAAIHDDLEDYEDRLEAIEIHPGDKLTKDLKVP